MSFTEQLLSTGAAAGVELRTSRLVPEGQVWDISEHGLGRALVAGPLTSWSLRHEGRWPLLSRYSPGMAALERERRS